VFIFANASSLTVEEFEKLKNNSKYLLINVYKDNNTLGEMMERLNSSLIANITYATTNNTELIKLLDVKKFPKLKWFMGGDEYEFRGEYTFQKVKRLLNSATSHWAVPLESQEQLDKFLQIPPNYTVAVSNDLEVDLKSLTTLLPTLTFGHLRYGGKDLLPPGTLRVYNNFNGTLHFYEYEDVDNVLSWLKEKSSMNIISQRWPLFRVMRKYSDYHLLFFGGINEEVKKLSEYSPKIIFVEVEPDNDYLYETFNISKPERTVVFVNKTNGFKFEKLQFENVGKFIVKNITKKKRPKRKTKHDEL
tara:strand:- start:1305 stop:2216 length:912 start_codon:yes stop_codon:yes gene_type:complete